MEGIAVEHPALALPRAPLQLRRDEAGRVQVYDALRRRWVVLTPEEWVRQHFVHFLVAHRGFPAALMGNEVGITLGGVTRRCDTVLFGREEARPRVIVEYKAPQVGITEAVFRQIESYNAALRADYLIVSNGLNHYACRLDYERQTSQFLRAVPHYAEL